MRNRRVFAYVGEIRGPNIENADAKFRIATACQIAHREEPDAINLESSFSRADVAGFPSNLLAANGAFVMIGDMIARVIAPNYGAFWAAQIERWRPRKTREWGDCGPARLPNQRRLNFDHGPSETPRAASYDLASMRYSITAARLAPIDDDVHTFHERPKYAREAYADRRNPGPNTRRRREKSVRRAARDQYTRIRNLDNPRGDPLTRPKWGRRNKEGDDSARRENAAPNPDRLSMAVNLSLRSMRKGHNAETHIGPSRK